MMIRPLLLLSIFLVVQQTFSQNFKISSPDKNILLHIKVDGTISWSASLSGNVLIKEAKIGMDFSSGVDFGVNSKVKDHTIEEFSSMIYPAIPHKDAEIKDEYVQLSINFKGQYQLRFRAYNEGVAYQFIDKNKRERNVISEKAMFTFPEGAKSFFPQEDSMYSHNERSYLNKFVNEISADEFCSLPVVFATDSGKVLFTETALHDYPGMFVRGNGNTSVDAIFPKFVLEVEDDKAQPDRNQTITQEADFIAQVSGNREYPWRVFIMSDDDRTFVESNLTYQLSRPQANKNTDWIKPGKVAWDWYNANNIYGVDFKSGLNTDTYKYYIDFASANKIEYVILDEGWTKSTTEILDFNPDIDVVELIRYGKEKGVDIILWTLWKPLQANLVEILETYKSWGAKGIKIDFIQRSDQYVVNSYEQIAKECARLELLVDFHGSYKPSGLRRIYPNVINYEGVKGSENNKWSKDVTPEHNVTIPFIRMAAGPMDYTPGAMSNRQKANFGISGKRPMSMGTRAHQVAMYVVYEAPLQMLCESPSRYYQEQETVDFITQIPTIWDETIVLQGAIGDYIAVARRKGDKWYIGAMTDWTSRDLELDLSFLKEGNYEMEVYRDGINANRYAEDYKIDVMEVNRESKIIAKMAPGGGWSAIITIPSF
ncbi:glycoside hydrolase family 97 protein [Arenibacter palladensis]|uniref:glycoside hydrolase family 97 protein n=1 Tax=Arenibacter palladensis TaxID=237373 RepID=UPI0026E284FC|nr:glycoside hydrolase family 97 protein [Arenibacter palladensis]MDO6602581.1 glycoside hydrolase family 97 protein [Arenibacter palladensis]